MCPEAQYALKVLSTCLTVSLSGQFDCQASGLRGRRHSTERRRAEHTESYNEWSYSVLTLTGDATQESQGRGVTTVVVDHALVCSLRLGYRQRNGFVELASPWFHCHDGRDGHSVAEQLRCQLSWYRLCLSHKQILLMYIWQVISVTYSGV